NYILIKFSEERCIQPYPEVIDYLNNTYVKYLYNPKGRSTSKNVTIATVEEEPLNKAALGGGIAGALVFLLLLIGLTVFLIRRYRNKQYRRHPASHVRYEFSVAMGMRKPKKCKDGFDVVRLKSGKKLAVPRVIDYAAAKRMVAEGEFGAFYEYESQGTSYWYKLEAKLGSRFKQPLANESGVYKLVEKYFKNPEKHFMYYGGMLGCCQFSEGVYCMRVEHFGPSVREMRGGQLMAPPEAKKLFFQLLHCIRAMIKYGISHRYIKESAFYAKQDEDKYWFVITDLGYAIRMGSERSAFYPIPELATTHIHAKKALKVEDAESLLFMILGMMAPLPWTGMEDMEEIRKTKLECTDEKSIAMEFKDIPEAVELCRMRGLYTDDVACENPADSLITCCLQTTPFEKMCLPVLFPNSNAKLVGTFQSYGS
uniref:Protein kinase domain-containing protein n=3 Tax=Bursaphelenchus xylophilus TaxID=6326 RepID=A0A1I7S1P6_BURXY